MKYTILINQVGIVKANLHKKTDFTDWAIIEYIKDWFFSDKKKTFHTSGKELVWINYKHLIESMPLLKINHSSNLVERFKKLRKLKLIETFHFKDNTLYVRPTHLAISIGEYRENKDDPTRSNHNSPTRSNHNSPTRSNHNSTSKSSHNKNNNDNKLLNNNYNTSESIKEKEIVFKSKYAEKVISYQNKIADKIKGYPHVRITKRNDSIKELEVCFKLLRGKTFLQNNSINDTSRKINNIPLKDEIEFEYKKHINRLSLLYKGEYEPIKKSILPKSLLALIYNSRSESSWLMQVMYNSPKKVSDKQMKDNHPEITKFFLDKFNGNVSNQNKLISGIRSIVNFTKHIPKKTMKVSILKREFGDPLSICKNYYDYLERQTTWMKDEIESNLIKTDNKLWNKFIKEAEEEDCDGYKLQ